MTTAIAGPLTGRVALVTGASSGIGRATALALAGAGASVAVGARRADRLDDLGARIRSEGGTVLVIELDVTDEAACERAVARVAAEWGPVDILVNNAGVMLLGPVVGADTGDWHRMVNTNLLGLMYLTHAVIGDMIARKAGDIVNISSIAGRTTRSGSAVYNATKWAVNAFSEALRQEVTKNGVRVSLIEPGAVATELPSRITHAETRERVLKVYGAYQQALSADDIADAVCYIVTQPPHIAVNEIMMRPTEQA
jgi:NADP-dependent 3-hydroxy acid dehydrogenase YdfG